MAEEGPEAPASSRRVGVEGGEGVPGAEAEAGERASGAGREGLPVGHRRGGAGSTVTEASDCGGGGAGRGSGSVSVSPPLQLLAFRGRLLLNRESMELVDSPTVELLLFHATVSPSRRWWPEIDRLSLGGVEALFFLPIMVTSQLPCQPCACTLCYLASYTALQQTGTKRSI